MLNSQSHTDPQQAAIEAQLLPQMNAPLTEKDIEIVQQVLAHLYSGGRSADKVLAEHGVKAGSPLDRQIASLIPTLMEGHAKLKAAQQLPEAPKEKSPADLKGLGFKEQTSETNLSPNLPPAAKGQTAGNAKPAKPFGFGVV